MAEGTVSDSNASSTFQSMRQGSGHPVEVSHTAVYPSSATRWWRLLRRNTTVVLLIVLTLSGLPQSLFVHVYEDFAQAGTGEREGMVTSALLLVIAVAIFIKMLRFAWNPGRQDTPDLQISYAIQSREAQPTAPDDDLQDQFPEAGRHRTLLIAALIAGWVATILLVALANTLLLTELSIERPIRSVISLVIGVVSGSLMSALCIRLYRRWI